MRRGGFSLVELLVAVVVLEIGLLGVAGMLRLAAEGMARAARLERAVSLAEATADSLDAAGWGGEGETSHGAFLVRWSRVGGVVRVDVFHHGGGPDALLRVAWEGP